VAPTDPLPVVRYDPRAGERSLDVMRWGLMPFWAKDIKVGFANINAKAEGIEGKPAFREAFQRRRCLVPVDNFYRGKTAAEMQPFAIALAEPQRPQHLPIGNRCGGPTMVQNMDVVLKRFEQPDEIRTFDKGKFEIVRIGGMTIGRATYEPGWRWSLHVGPATGTSSCSVEHVGMVISGRATAAMDNGTITEMSPGDIFDIAPGHDSWVVGDEPYVSLHFLGADLYADDH